MPSPSASPEPVLLRTDPPTRSPLRRLVAAAVPSMRLALAARSAVAAVLAWYAAGLVPEAAEYRYYAPLGAVLATYPTVADTVATAWRSLLAVAVGGLIGAACLLLPELYGLTLLLAVGAGVLVGASRPFGAQRGWVPTAALFTLVVGAQDPVLYLASYAGLVLLGAVIGTVVTVVTPSLPLGGVARAGAQARQAVARLLADLADQVEDPASGPPGGAVQDRVRAVRAALRRARTEEAVGRKASRGNVRASRHRRTLERETQALQGVDRVAVVSSDLADSLSGTDVPAVLADADPDLPRRVARALRATGEAVGSAGDREALRAAAHDAVDEVVGPARHDLPGVAFEVVAHLRRLLAGLAVLDDLDS